jgi:hypothetical protein
MNYSRDSKALAELAEAVMKLWVTFTIIKIKRMKAISPVMQCHNKRPELLNLDPS